MRNDAELEKPGLQEPRSVPNGRVFEGNSLFFLTERDSQQSLVVPGTCTQDDVFSRVKAFLPRIKRANQDVVKESQKKHKQCPASVEADSIVAIERLDDDDASVPVKSGEAIALPNLHDRTAGSLASGDASPLLMLRSRREERESVTEEKKGEEKNQAPTAELSVAQVEMEICLGVFDMPSAERMTMQEATERGMTLVEKDSLPLWNVSAHKPGLIQELSSDSDSDSDGKGEEGPSD